MIVLFKGDTFKYFHIFCEGLNNFDEISQLVSKPQINEEISLYLYNFHSYNPSDIIMHGYSLEKKSDPMNAILLIITCRLLHFFDRYLLALQSRR